MIPVSAGHGSAKVDPGGPPLASWKEAIRGVHMERQEALAAEQADTPTDTTFAAVKAVISKTHKDVDVLFRRCLDRSGCLRASSSSLGVSVVLDSDGCSDARTPW